MTKLVGILNLTPDSFSGDGLLDAPQAYRRIQELCAQGAYAVDIGAESTRPGATPISADDEWARLAPLMEYIRQLPEHPRVSIDTYHAATAEKAIRCGAAWINDVSGGKDHDMLVLARDTDVTLVLMHSLTLPASAQHVLPEHVDVIAEISRWAEEILLLADAMRLPRERLILDPGIGFGKTRTQSWDIIARMDQLLNIQVQWMVGHSRKSFLTDITDAPAHARDPETVFVSWKLAEQNVHFLRVHDVAMHAAMLKVRERLC